MTCYPVDTSKSGGTTDGWSKLTVNRAQKACKRVLNDDEEEYEACIWTPPGAKATESNDSDSAENVTDSNDSDTDAKEDETDETFIMIIIAISVGCSAIILTLIGLCLCYKKKSCCFKKKDQPTVRDAELQHGNF